MGHIMIKKLTHSQEVIVIIITAVLLVGLIIATAFTGGNIGEYKEDGTLNLSKSYSDIAGTWYSVENNSVSITFNEDGTYTSENYLTKGSYSLKKGVILMDDVYNDTTKLYLVNNSDGDLVLYYKTAAFVSVFSKAMDTSLAGISSVPIEEPMSDGEQLVASSIIQTLCAMEWDGQDEVLGKECKLAFTKTTLLIKEDSEEHKFAYHLDKPNEEKDGFSSLIYVDTDECSLVITIKPEANEYLYSLQINSKDGARNLSYAAQWRGERIEYAST